jgi:hypothetical protein
VATTTATSFNDTGLAPGSTHTYVVEPVDGAQTVGPPSPASDPITVMSAFVGRIAHLRLLA